MINLPMGMNGVDAVDPAAAAKGNPQRYRLITRGNYPMDEVASALQKTIRRGREEEALFWALELESSYPVYVWKRLMIIACEDIGMANPQAAILVQSLWAGYEAIRKSSATKHVDEDVLTFAVLYLCRSLKNREVDEFKNAVAGARDKGLKLEVPDYALDMHTQRGRAMGRTIKDFWLEGSKISPEVGGSKYRVRARVETAGEALGAEDDPDNAIAPA